MSDVSWISAFTQSLAALLHRWPALQELLDLTLKSVVLLAIFFLVDAFVSKNITNTSRHLLWLSSLLCLALLPLSASIFWLWGVLWHGGEGTPAQTALFELSVYAAQLERRSPVDWGLVLLALYLIAVAVFFGKLWLAMHKLGKLRLSSVSVTDTRLISRLNALRHQLGISRPVTLCINHRIESPVSFGLVKPQIMLPAQAHTWNQSTLTDVLLHELCHIKRLDWLTTLFAYVMVCVFWINPLVWLAARRLREESEHSCDTAVLHTGRSDTDYAESLLAVAGSCIHARRKRQNNRTNRSSNPLLQTMLDQNTLKTRISRVLEENKMKVSEFKKEIRSSVALLLVLGTGVLVALGSHQLLHAQQQPDPAARTIDQEMLPLNIIVPRYPTVAANASIEGWAQVSFTVNADGSVADSSVSIIDAEPANIFNDSAIAAAKQFMFNPRIVAGQPVDVPNVQYVFRYYMTEESERAAQL